MEGREEGKEAAEREVSPYIAVTPSTHRNCNHEKPTRKIQRKKSNSAPVHESTFLACHQRHESMFPLPRLLTPSTCTTLPLYCSFAVLSQKGETSAVVGS